MRKLSVILLFIAVSLYTSSYHAVLAQNQNPADIQFELGAYHLAISSYLDALKSNPDDLAVIEKLAIAYTRTNQPVRAARMYDQLLNSGSQTDPNHYLAYGHVLRSMGLYDQAKEIYEKCTVPEFEGLAQHYAKMAATGSQMMAQRDAFEVYLLKSSTKNDDFNPSFWKDALVFSSFTNDEMDANPLNTKRNKLFKTTSRSSKSMVGVTGLKPGSIDWNGVNSVHFSPDQTRIVFTRNNFKNGNKHILGNEQNLSVYMAEADQNGSFINEAALPVNSTEYSVAFACFGDDNNTLYFSSNMHGSKTDFDLYQINFEQGKWSAPMRLGDNINTPGNEIAPYYVNGTLYFASDFHPGLGGYDIFTSRLLDGVWTLPENLGKGINSIGDETSLVYDPAMEEYYYTSNRLGGKGSYDIYYSKRIQPTESVDPMLAAGQIPQAIALESLIDPQAVDIKTSPSAQVGFRDNVMAPDDLSLEGAVMVAYGEIINTTMRVYFVQLASLSSEKGNFERYTDLVDFGNVYRVRKDNSYKIRLGYFYGETEAKSILSSVRNKGYKDAFLVEEMLNVKELELLVSKNSFHKNIKYTKPEIESIYKVRLAAYSNPLYFDVEKVKDLGVIEQWSKDKWTIFILSGYSGLEHAKSAQIKAINRGFTGAEVVIDRDGVLSRANEN